MGNPPRFPWVCRCSYATLLEGSMGQKLLSSFTSCTNVLVSNFLSYGYWNADGNNDFTFTGRIWPIDKGKKYTWDDPIPLGSGPPTFCNKRPLEKFQGLSLDTTIHFRVLLPWNKFWNILKMKITTRSNNTTHLVARRLKRRYPNAKGKMDAKVPNIGARSPVVRLRRPTIKRM